MDLSPDAPVAAVLAGELFPAEAAELGPLEADLEGDEREAQQDPAAHQDEHV